MHYHPEGMLQAGRKYSATDSYRYGFNGKENDNEVKGEGNQQDYGMRIYDPRLGRFLSVDPLQKDYPELTPYQFASNTPIQAIDLDGLEKMHFIYEWHPKSGLTFIKVVSQFYQGTLGEATRQALRSTENIKYNEDIFETNKKGKELPFSNSFTVYYYNSEGETTYGSWSKFQRYSSLDELLKANHNEIGNQPRQSAFTAGDMVAMTIESGWQESLFYSTSADISFSNSTNYAASESLSPSGTVQYKTGSINNGINTNGAKTNTVSTAQGTKFGGRPIIVDENLSPSIAMKLKDAGYTVKTFAKGTSDQDIISWAKANNGAVLTNNIKDFKNKGVLTLEVPVSLTSKNQVQTVVNRIEVLHRNMESHGNNVYNSNSNVNLEKDAAVQHH